MQGFVDDIEGRDKDSVNYRKNKYTPFFAIYLNECIDNIYGNYMESCREMKTVYGFFHVRRMFTCISEFTPSRSPSDMLG